MLADAATSILAIVALFGGKWWGADWLDPLMGIAGAVLVAIWARGLLADCARVLLDAEMDSAVVSQIRSALSTLPGRFRLEDLHVWRVAHDRHACILALSVLPSSGDGSGTHVVRGLDRAVAEGTDMGDGGVVDMESSCGSCVAPPAGEALSRGGGMSEVLPTPQEIRHRLAGIPSLAHVTVEIAPA